MSFCPSKVIRLEHSFLPREQNDAENKENRSELSMSGGFLSSTNYVWASKGPQLEVINDSSGHKIGSWTFGSVLNDLTCEIVCVDTIKKPQGKAILLAVGVNFQFGNGMICIFNAATSKVIRAIHLQEGISSLHVIDSGCDISTIPGPLRIFDGIISVGTTGGNVYLLDMCLQNCDEDIFNIDSTKLKDELCPCEILIITNMELDGIEHLKTKALRHGNHLAIHLNAVVDKSTEHFVLKDQNGDDRLYVNKDEVVVSSLHFCPQLASLLVGYNFGAFQMWNLLELELVYTSPVCDDHIPVTHFAIQEPVDDPRAFCYIWVVYGPETLYQKIYPHAVMYAFCYSSKEYVEDYGIIYQGFQSSSIRFQMELNVMDPDETASESRGARCFRMSSINRGLISKDASMIEGNDDVLALCMIAWTVWTADYQTCTYVALFDLNQWYKEQMPNFPTWDQCSNYLIQVCASDLVSSIRIGTGPLLDIDIPKKTLNQFVGSQRLEEHFYPTSLIFDLYCLREGCIFYIHSRGLQKTLLMQLEAAGPLCLAKPTDIYQQVISVGLVPLFAEISPKNPSLDLQREIILTVALEQQLIGWLCKCASEWANGSYLSVGCSLDSMLNWAFHRVVTLKSNCDKYCVSLFDYSENKLDTNANKLFKNCIKQIRDLSVFYSHVTEQLTRFLVNPELSIEHCNFVHIVATYFEVLEWMLNIGLLPECPTESYSRFSSNDRIAVPYSSAPLSKYFLDRRVALKELNNSRFTSDKSLLFIDNLIDNECSREAVQREWERDGNLGFYPPRSLQAFLRTYLVESMTPVNKHMVATYLFLDMVTNLNHPRYDPITPQLLKFPLIFNVPLSIVKLTQAFWELDHSHFRAAIEQLLDPLISTEDFKPWHHKIALRAFLLQDQQNFALLYFQVRKPPVLDEEDILTALSLYVASQMFDEAINFKKLYQKNCDEENILMHLYRECYNYGCIKHLFDYSMSDFEEQVFLKFLKKQNNDKLLISYHILKSHYLEAFRSHETSKTEIQRTGLMGQSSASHIDSILSCVRSVIAPISSNLLQVCQKEKTGLWKQVDRPTPMSVFVHDPKEKLHYKSTVIQAALTKAKRTFNDSLFERLQQDKGLCSEEVPFLKTPSAFPSKKRKIIQVITPKIIEVEDYEECLSAKKIKLTPRVSPFESVRSKFDTPVVERKITKIPSSGRSQTEFTPHSILKVRDSVPRELDYSDLERTKARSSEERFGVESSLKKRVSLTPRRSVSLPRPVVRFEDRYSVSVTDSSQSKTSPISSVESTPQKAVTCRRSLLENTREVESSLETADDEFHSAENSIESKEKALTVDSSSLLIRDSPVLNTDMKDVNIFERDEPEHNTSSDLKTQIVEKINIEDELLSQKKAPVTVYHSPRSRRSIRCTTSPVRSSPRLAMKSEASMTVSVPQDESLPSTSKVISSPGPKYIRKLSSRQSLSRHVLESNALKSLPILSASIKESATPENPSNQSLFKSDTSINTEREDVSVSTLGKTNFSKEVIEVTVSSDREEEDDVKCDKREKLKQNVANESLTAEIVQIADDDEDIKVTEDQNKGIEKSEDVSSTLVKTSDEVQIIEESNVDIYEDLDDDDEVEVVSDNKKDETPVYEDISSSRNRDGDPEMNNFEYNVDLSSYKEDNRSSKEYFSDESLGNILERNIIEESVFNEVSDQSPASSKSSVNLDEAFMQETNPNTPDLSNRKIPDPSITNSGQASPSQVNENVIEIRSSSSEASVNDDRDEVNSDDNDNNENLDDIPQDNIEYYTESSEDEERRSRGSNDDSSEDEKESKRSVNSSNDDNENLDDIPREDIEYYTESSEDEERRRRGFNDDSSEDEKQNRKSLNSSKETDMGRGSEGMINEVVNLVDTSDEDEDDNPSESKMEQLEVNESGDQEEKEEEKEEVLEKEGLEAEGDSSINCMEDAGNEDKPEEESIISSISDEELEGCKAPRLFDYSDFTLRIEPQQIVDQVMKESPAVTDTASGRFNLFQTLLETDVCIEKRQSEDRSDLETTVDPVEESEIRGNDLLGIGNATGIPENEDQQPKEHVDEDKVGIDCVLNVVPSAETREANSPDLEDIQENIPQALPSMRTESVGMEVSSKINQETDCVLNVVPPPELSETKMSDIESVKVAEETETVLSMETISTKPEYSSNANQEIVVMEKGDQQQEEETEGSSIVNQEPVVPEQKEEKVQKKLLGEEKILAVAPSRANQEPVVLEKDDQQQEEEIVQEKSSGEVKILDVAPVIAENIQLTGEALLAMGTETAEQEGSSKLNRETGDLQKQGQQQEENVEDTKQSEENIPDNSDIELVKMSENTQSAAETLLTLGSEYEKPEGSSEVTSLPKESGQSHSSILVELNEESTSVELGRSDGDVKSLEHEKPIQEASCEMNNVDEPVNSISHQELKESDDILDSDKSAVVENAANKVNDLDMPILAEITSGASLPNEHAEESAEKQSETSKSQKRASSVKSNPLTVQRRRSSRLSLSNKELLEARSVESLKHEEAPADTEIKDTSKGGKRKGRPASISDLPIEDDDKKVVKRSRTRSVTSDINEYSNTRRLTRRQAALLQKSFTNPLVLISPMQMPVVEEIDPIQLLDKPTFKGKPDPEEKKVYDISPNGSVGANSASAVRRTRRSTSVVSDISPNNSDVGTPRTTRSSVESSARKGVKTRSRKGSIDTVSLKSEDVTPPKRRRKKSEESEVSEAGSEVTTRSTRSRTKSIASNASADSKAITRSSKRKLQSGKSELPGIREER